MCQRPYSLCTLPDKKESSGSAEEQKSERLEEAYRVNQKVRVHIVHPVQWRDYVVALAKAALGVDYTCISDVYLGCAFPGRMRFRCHFQSRKLKNDIKNVFDSETQIKTAHPKRKCNRPLITHPTQRIDRHRINPLVPNAPQFITAQTLCARGQTCNLYNDGL
jgi:hypothetical protein